MDAEMIEHLRRAYALTMDNPEAQDEIEAAIAALSATPQAEVFGFLIERGHGKSRHYEFSNHSAYVDETREIGLRVIPVYTTPQAAQVPAGYALVPVEPTDEMIAACKNATPTYWDSDETDWFDNGDAWGCWAAMLAAAQAQGVGRG